MRENYPPHSSISLGNQCIKNLFYFQGSMMPSWKTSSLAKVVEAFPVSDFPEISKSRMYKIIENVSSSDKSWEPGKFKNLIKKCLC